MANQENVRLIAFFDNEEVGSESNRGADSNLLISTMERINGSKQNFETACQKSFLVSADMAHAVHPNYVSKVLNCNYGHQDLVVCLSTKHNIDQKWEKD